MSEWNLSSKIINLRVDGAEEGGIVPAKHIKEFIRRLKEELVDDNINDAEGHIIEGIIDKLAGEGLI